VTVLLSENHVACATTTANMESSDISRTPDVRQSQPSIAVISNTPAKVDDTSESRFQGGFGCLTYRPACLQFLARARWFLLFMCLTQFCGSAKGLLGVIISTIERRFGLSSSQSAWIVASYEIAGVPALLIIGYLGSTIRRPLCIGTGMIMIGVGLAIFTVPHFAAPPYRFTESSDSSNLCVETVSSVLINANLSMSDRCALRNVYKLNCLNDSHNISVLQYARNVTWARAEESKKRKKEKKKRNSEM